MHLYAFIILETIMYSKIGLYSGKVQSNSTTTMSIKFLKTLSLKNIVYFTGKNQLEL